jgi:cytochrome P450
MSGWTVEPPADPYFDRRLNAWIVSRYRDVAVALREPGLLPALARSTAPPTPIDPAVHANFRAQALRALAPAVIQQREERFDLVANRLAEALPAGEPVELMDRYARPFSLAIAGIMAEVPPGECESLATLARPVFDSACEPYDEALAAAARKAIVELAWFFREARPWGVQMFIALAHSLPAFLGNAWLALLDSHVEVADMPKAIDELLRLAGPAKAQFRQAIATVTIRQCHIAREQRAILRLDIANRDPDEFSDPGEIRFGRSSPAHLAFGTGLHACVGAALVRSAAGAATKALLDRFHLGEYTAVPVDCFAVRYVASLSVALQGRGS